MRFYIYAIRNPLTNRVRYIGRTERPRSRFSQHRTLIKTGRTKWKSALRLSREFRRAKCEPVFEILEIGRGAKNAMRAENKWMGRYRKSIINLNACQHPPTIFAKPVTVK